MEESHPTPPRIMELGSNVKPSERLTLQSTTSNGEPNAEKCFLDLSRELRDMIYVSILAQDSNLIVQKIDSHNETYPLTEVNYRRYVWETEGMIFKREPMEPYRCQTIYESSRATYSMLFVCRQVSLEFVEAVNRNAPHYLGCELHIGEVDEVERVDRQIWPSRIGQEQFDFAAHVKYLHINIHLEYYDVRTPIMETEAFQDVLQLIRGCAQTTHLAVDCVMDKGACITRPKVLRDGESLYSDSEQTDIGSEHLLPAIRSLPRLLRYSLEWTLLKGRRYRRAKIMYGRRDGPIPWDAADDRIAFWEFEPDKHWGSSSGRYWDLWNERNKMMEMLAA